MVELDVDEAEECIKEEQAFDREQMKAYVELMDDSRRQTQLMEEIEAMMPLLNASIHTDQIGAALAQAQGEMDKAFKNAQNPHFRSNYADLATIIAAARPALSKYGLAVTQRVSTGSTTVSVETIILHESGQFISDGGLTLPVGKQDAQGFGAAITYARRYGFASVVGLAQEDDDGNSASQTAPQVHNYNKGTK